MFQATLARHDDLETFRRLLRHLLAHGIAPDDILWTGDGARGLLPETNPDDAPPIRLPSAYATIAAAVICHRDARRLDRLYRLAWRIEHGERRLFACAADPLVHDIERLRKAVARDRHKMTAFVRFRGVAATGPERFVAWFEPEHHILRHVAPFFVDRFANMNWAILTQLGSIAWTGGQLEFGPPCARTMAPDDDALDDWWRSYYAATFNPARANAPAMRAEMPKRYWHNLPEAKLIPALLAQARDREGEMLARSRANDDLVT